MDVRLINREGVQRHTPQEIPALLRRARPGLDRCSILGCRSRVVLVQVPSTTRESGP